MRALYDEKARKRTVSLTLNADLYAKARESGINASQVAEEALAQELARRRQEMLRAEIRRDLEAYNQYVEEHGSFAEMVREHYADSGDHGAV
ncbi:MAG TPA: type II toxin-antitoxin system CcdA family antitoxin [Azospirillaceae bacterium]|nr:type II toxin-antitoxin system CcdA family antitoxin [Azospirillaceae bacterium]